MAFRDILKNQRSSGSGIISSLGTASMASLRSTMDPRNYLFKSGGVLNALFPKVKGYQYKDTAQKIKTSGDTLNATLSSDKLDGVIQRLDIVGKNTMVLPMMSRDMNIARQSLVKLVKLNGGTQRDKADRFFSRAKESENLYESKLGMKSTSTSPTPAKKEDGGSLGGFLKSLFIGGALIAGIGKLLEIPEIRETLKGFLKGFIESVFNGIKEIVKIVFETEIEISGFKLSLGTAIATTIAGFVGFKLAIAALTAYIMSQIGGFGKGSPRGLPPTIPERGAPGGPGGKVPSGKAPPIPGSTGGTAAGVGGRALGALGFGLSLYEIAKFAAEAEYGKRMSEGAGKLAPKAFKDKSQPIIDLEKSGYTREQAKTVLDGGSDRDIEKLGGRENIQKYIDNKTPSSFPGGASPGANNVSGTALQVSAGSQLQGPQKEFYDKLYTTLLAEATKAGVKNPEAIARLGAAQSSIETGYGKALAGGNNFFGIKGSGGNQQTTQEWDPKTQKMVTQKASFRQYGSMQESASDYIKFLQTNSRYKGVLEAGSVEEAIAAQGKTGYATDPNYAKKLAWVQSSATGTGVNLPAAGSSTMTAQSSGSPGFDPTRVDGGSAYQPGEKQYAENAAAQGNVVNLAKFNTDWESAMGSTSQSGQVLASGSTPRVATLDLTQSSPAQQSGQVARPASMVSDSSTALADARAAFATNPIIINSPTGKMPASPMAQNSQQPQYTAPAVVDSEFMKLLVSRATA